MDYDLIKTIAEYIILPSIVASATALHLRFKSHRSTVSATKRKCNIDKIRGNGILTFILIKYYALNENLSSEGLLFTANIDNQCVDVGIMVRPGETFLSVPLDTDSVKCHLLEAAPPPLVVPNNLKKTLSRRTSRVIEDAEKSGGMLWNDPVYRLSRLSISQQEIDVSFWKDDYFAFRFSGGLLREELVDALVACDCEVNKVLADRSRYLPLRGNILPDTKALQDFNTHICAGGVAILFAVARPDPFDDYYIFTHQRSAAVSMGQHEISVVPQGIHQHSVDANEEVHLSRSVFREIYEEIFGGKEVERDAARITSDWWHDACEPVKWLLCNPKAYTLECTGFGVGLINGDYHFSVLLAVHDINFWNVFVKYQKLNWETATTGITSISSKDYNRLISIIRQHNWVPEGLFSFIQGLHRLAQLDSGRCKIPKIES